MGILQKAIRLYVEELLATQESQEAVGKRMGRPQTTMSYWKYRKGINQDFLDAISRYRGIPAAVVLLQIAEKMLQIEGAKQATTAPPRSEQ